MRDLVDRVRRALGRPYSSEWLSVLRIGLGIQILLYCLSLRGDWIQLFTTENRGLIRRDLAEAVLSGDSRLIPRIGWLVELGGWIGFTETNLLWCIWIILLLSSLLLLAGLFTRIAAIASWILYVCAARSAELFSYGVDNFTIIGLFYLAVAPLPDAWSLDVRWRGIPLRAGALQGLHRRVLQFHVCVIYFFGGITKCAGQGWWTGDSLWRALTRAPFDIIPREILIRGQYILPLLGICVCVMEATYPLFIWLRKTRLIWFVGVLTMHVGIGLTMGMYSFATIMIVLNLAAFGPGFAFPLSFRPLALFSWPKRRVSVG